MLNWDSGSPPTECCRLFRTWGQVRRQGKWLGGRSTRERLSLGVLTDWVRDE